VQLIWTAALPECRLSELRDFPREKPEFLFVIRNAKQSTANFALASVTMAAILRGERSGSGRLPELRRYWIYREARGLER
jgi:hypothetical protein